MRAIAFVLGLSIAGWLVASGASATAVETTLKDVKEQCGGKTRCTANCGSTTCDYVCNKTRCAVTINMKSVQTGRSHRPTNAPKAAVSPR